MNLTAPNSSAEYSQLRQCAQWAGLEDELRAFLHEINAHPHLIALFLVCQNVCEAIDKARAAWGHGSEISELSSWDKPLAWLNSNQASLAKAIGRGVCAEFSSNGRHPLWSKGLQRHSVYAAMCNTPNDTTKCERYRLLQAHLLVANALLMRKHASLGIYEAYDGKKELLSAYAYAYGAGFAVRLISEQSGHLNTLQPELPPAEFAKHLRLLIDPHTDEKSGGTKLIGADSEHKLHYGNLAVFLEKALAGREQRIVNSSSHWGPGNRLWVSGGRSDFKFMVLESEYEDEDGKTQQRSHKTYKRISRSAKEVQELLDLDDDPLEDEEEEETDSTDPASGKGVEPGDYQEVSTAWANHVEMANQLFPWGFGYLVPEELENIIVRRPAELLAIVRERTPSQQEMAELETLALIQVMFWTASSFDRARGLRIADSFAKEDDADLLLRLPSDTGYPWWRIRSPLPDYQQEQPTVDENLRRENSPFLELPDVVGASTLVAEFLRLRPPSTKSPRKSNLQESMRAFRGRRPTYRGNICYVIDRLAPESRVTEGRIANFMVQQALQRSRGDLSAAAIVTGRDLSLATVRLFYACRSARRLQRLYVKCCLSVKRQLEQPGDRNEVNRQPLSLNAGKLFIGNRLCPSVSGLHNAVVRLIEEIKTCEKRHRITDAVRHHNLYTLYTIWMFSYTTGVRGIKTPYLPITQIDEHLGIATIADKDGGLGYKTKLIWMWPQLLEQMRCYADFLGRSLRFQAGKQWPCFFVDENISPVEARPASIKPIMSEFLPFPVNIHRRFVSSELLDRGCPQEVVSAWMGHWHRGEEPWAKYSSFSYSEYRQSLEKYLIPLLENDLGFHPVKSY